MTKNVNHNYFSTYNPESCYWAGFIAADGNISKKTNAVQVALGEKDLEHLNKLKFSLQSDHAVVKDNNCYRLSFYSKQIQEDLRYNFSIVPAKSFILEFPLLPEKYLKYFILGYFDGDGHVSLYKSIFTKNNKEYSYNRCEVGFTSASLLFTETLYNHISIVGSITEQNNAYRVKYSSKKAIKEIFNYFYGDSDVLRYCLLRKYNKFIEALEDIKKE